MEEILASIRRIIESNEPGPAGAFSGQLPPVYDDEDDSVVETAFVSEPTSPPAHVPPAANQGYGARQASDYALSSESNNAVSESGPQKTMSLADVAARVRAAADRNAAMGPQAFAAQRPVEQLPLSSNPAFQQERATPVVRPTDIRPLMAVAQTLTREEPATPQREEVAVAPPQQDVPAWENVDLRGAVEAELQQPSMPELPRFEVPESKPASEAQPEQDALSLSLISAAAGAQIARSFSELAEVFDGVQRQSIEEMAQDMLRPMLHDWLEDNLPTLVERLVREEIERVARGPRR
jgi:cell pole-organizing protein PopZ